MKPKVILEEHGIENLLQQFILGQTVIISYYNFNEYKRKRGMIIKIDRLAKILYLSNLKIPFVNIVDITS